MTDAIPCPIAETADAHPDLVAINAPDQTWTYRGLHEAITRQTRALTTAGIRAGDRVALNGLPAVATITRLFALWRMGAWAAVMNDRLPADTRAEVLAGLDCRAVLSAIDADQTKINITGPADRVPRDLVPGPAPEKTVYTIIPADQSAVMIRTSGSTHGPKTVVLSFANLYENARGANAHLPVQPGDRWLLSLPLYHVSGLGILLRTFLAGATVVVADAAAGLADQLAGRHITHVSLVPTQLFRLLNTPRHTATTEARRCLKAILLGGGPIPTRLIQDGLKIHLPIYVTYGLTEMGSQVATSAPLKSADRLSARVLTGRELRIGAHDEIQVKGPCLFQGYWGQGRLTRPLTPDGWFATGDLGGRDEQGDLIVRGRRDLMFISAGENICPEEIERVLLNIPGVEQAVVVPRDDAEYGQVPVAFLSGPGLNGLTTAALRARLKAVLPAIKVPQQFYQLPEQLAPGLIKAGRATLRQTLAQPVCLGLHSLPT